MGYQTGCVKIDVTPPATPTVNRYQSSLTFSLSGTWAYGDAVSLEVEVAGKRYTLGEHDELAADREGNWFFLPSRLPGEGTYDVAVVTRDVAGNISRDQTKDELVIKFSEDKREDGVLEEMTRPLNGFMCQREFKRMLAASRVEFLPNSPELSRTGRNVIDGLAGIAARCVEARLEIGVHTDSRGDFSANRRLSVARAAKVLQQFVRRGIERSRLASVGYGEIKPIATNKTESGRARNRRVEIFVKQ